jgi:hypothetical protein
VLTATISRAPPSEPEISLGKSLCGTYSTPIDLMMETVSTSETSVSFYEITRRNISEDSHFHTRRREKLKYEKYTWFARYIVRRSGFDPGREKNFSSSLCVQTGSGSHPASYPMGNGGPFPGVNRGWGVTLTTHPI